MAVANELAKMLPSSTFNFTGFEDEETMVASLQAREPNRFGCFRNGAGVLLESEVECHYVVIFMQVLCLRI